MYSQQLLSFLLLFSTYLSFYNDFASASEITPAGEESELHIVNVELVPAAQEEYEWGHHPPPPPPKKKKKKKELHKGSKNKG